MNLLDAYNSAFGYKGVPAVIVRQTAIVPPGSIMELIPTTQSFAEDATGNFKSTTSTLGTPFFMPCKLDGFQLPNEPIITIRGTKTIVKTPIDGNEGTFKQLFSLGDYFVNIKGICVLDEDSDEYPEDQVRAIRRIIEKKTGVDVVCKLLSLWNINHLAIETFDFPAIEGAPGMQPYELNCSSDKFFDLELLEGND